MRTTSDAIPVRRGVQTRESSVYDNEIAIGQMTTCAVLERRRNALIRLKSPSRPGLDMWTGWMYFGDSSVGRRVVAFVNRDRNARGRKRLVPRFFRLAHFESLIHEGIGWPLNFCSRHGSARQEVSRICRHEERCVKRFRRGGRPSSSWRTHRQPQHMGRSYCFSRAQWRLNPFVGAWGQTGGAWPSLSSRETRDPTRAGSACSDRQPLIRMLFTKGCVNGIRTCAAVR